MTEQDDCGLAAWSMGPSWDSPAGFVTISVVRLVITPVEAQVPVWGPRRAQKGSLAVAPGSRQIRTSNTHRVESERVFIARR